MKHQEAFRKLLESLSEDLKFVFFSLCHFVQFILLWVQELVLIFAAKLQIKTSLEDPKHTWQSQMEPRMEGKNFLCFLPSASSYAENSCLAFFLGGGEVGLFKNPSVKFTQFNTWHFTHMSNLLDNPQLKSLLIKFYTILGWSTEGVQYRSEET